MQTRKKVTMRGLPNNGASTGYRPLVRESALRLDSWALRGEILWAHGVPCVPADHPSVAAMANRTPFAQPYPISTARHPALRDDVFILIAAYHEASVIGRVVGELRERYANVVVVDDGSTDGTDVAAREAGALVLRHVVNRGQGAALQTALTYA